MEFDQYLLNEFVAEANEHLSTIEDDFLTLESQSAEPDSALMDKLFRAIHSIKGGSGFLGLDKINLLSHAMENLLSKMRGHELRPESRYIDTLLAGVDLLRTMIAAPIERLDTDIVDIQKRLAEYVAQSEDRGKSSSPSPSPQGMVTRAAPRTALTEPVPPTAAKRAEPVPSAPDPAPSPQRLTTRAAPRVESPPAFGRKTTPESPPLAAPLAVQSVVAAFKRSGPAVDQLLVDEFKAEANEHLATLIEDFLALEAQPDTPDSELVDKVFRAVHSVKGGAGFLGFQRISELGHAMESLLSKIRAGEIKPEKIYVDGLLRGVDLLNAMVADPVKSEDVDIGEVKTRLTELLTSKPQPAPEQALASSPVASSRDDPEKKRAGSSISEQGAGKSPLPVVSAPLSAGLSVMSSPGRIDLSGLDVDEVCSRTDFVYWLEYDLSEISRVKGVTPAVALRELEKKGEILAAELYAEAPSLAAGDKRKAPGLASELVWASALDPDQALEVLGLTEEHMELLVAQQTPVYALACESGVGAPARPKALDGADKPSEELAAEKDEAEPEDARDAASPRSPSTGSSPDGTPSARGVKRPSGALEKTGTIRINVGILDKLMTLAGELVLVRNQQLLSMERLDSANRDIVQRLDIVTSELQETIMRTRMQPIGNVFGKLPRIVRDLSARLNKQISIEILGNEVELDKTILESLNDPLTHIIRNSCDHGVETPAQRKKAGKPATGLIRVRAFHEGGQINIEIKDDGKGLDPAMIRRKALERGIRTEAELSQMSDKETLQLIHLPGFSTAEKVSDVSGRGVGMDVVKHAIEDLGGSIDLESWVGEGASIQLRLPLTLAIIPCLIVMVGKSRFAIPQVNLVELVRLYDEDVHARIEVAGNQEVYRLRDRLLPMVRLNEVLARPKPFSREGKAEIAERYRGESEQRRESLAQGAEEGEQTLNFAVVKVGADRFGLIVDSILGTEEIVVKPMHGALKPLKCYSGATVMGDGSVALILDIEGVARHAGVFLEPHGDIQDSPSPAGASLWDTQSILLFQSGDKERFALALPLIRRIEKISMSRMERIGKKEFITVDDCSTLVLRLNNYLSVATSGEQDDMFLILPKFITRPFGILMSTIIDIVETPVNLNTESYMEDGLLGTDIISGHLTLFPDIYRLIELAEPQWFAERRRSQPPPKEKKRVLVVEDSAFLRQMVSKYLEADNYEPVSVEHGRAALDMLHEREFDLVVSDIEMPVMNGLEFIKNMRHTAQFKDLPAMALTSLKTEEDRRRALEAGFDAYQIKIDREQFLAEAARLLLAARGAPSPRSGLPRNPKPSPGLPRDEVGAGGAAWRTNA
jgi:two-component system chemotaxis sensor kinase CheA